ncbi:hypothetical protein OAO01_02045 [Oligoflexia bacterium]|nr:hypothetical protein [Oligoflexia bacterium]
MKNTTATLEIRRHLPVKNATTKTVCFPGGLTVLTDEEGDGGLMPYTLALSGQPLSQQGGERFTITWNGAPLEVAEQTLVGFGEMLPSALSIEAFLLQAGYAKEELLSEMETYELDRINYLNCGQLSATATRQLLLLAALKADTPVLVLNDPFQPFNGRWRGHFAELLVKNAIEKQRVVLITGLSFVPQAWVKREELSYVDVGKAAVRAAKRAESMARIEDAAAAAAKAIPDQPKKEPGTGKTFEFELPEYIVFAYKETCDHIFEPLGRLANHLRSYSGATAVLGLALLVGLMGYIMFPNLGQYHEKIKGLAADVSWSDVSKAALSPKSPDPVKKDQKQSSQGLGGLARNNNELAPEATVIEVALVAPEPSVAPRAAPKDLQLGLLVKLPVEEKQDINICDQLVAQVCSDSSEVKQSGSFFQEFWCGR